ncbi:MAG: S8 family serine peptidase [Anaerolineae bacterium]
MHKRLRLLLIGACLAILVVALPGPATAEEGLPDDAVFLGAASRLYGAEAQALEVEHKALSTLADGRKVYWAKVWDRLAENVYDVALDGSLRPIPAAEAQAMAREAYLAKYGKLAESLHGQLQALGQEDILEVAIALKTPAGLDVARPSPDDEGVFSDEALEALWSEEISAYQEGVAAVERPFVAELVAAGHEVTYVSPDTPLVLARLPKRAILALSEHPAVSQVWGTRVMEEEIDKVKRSVNATSIWSEGATGRGIKVGVSEVGAKARAANPYLALAWNQSYTSCGYSSHGTAVAGIIKAFKSSDSAYRGMAFRSQVYYYGACVGYWDRLKEGWEKLRKKGVQIINASWGGDNNRVPDYTDMEIDTYARNYGKFMVKSAGNRGAGSGCPYSDGHVTNPGLGYNVMTVGNFDHQRTPTWTDDTMKDTCSSYADPKSLKGDREKPEVVAPGTEINSTLNRTSAPWMGNVGSGTSYSAPVVAGLAADLMQVQPGLKGWPEATRAIIMAAARNGVNESYGGGDGKGLRTSDQAGAGGLDFQAAYRIATGKQGGWQKKTVYYDTFNNLPVSDGFASEAARYFYYNVQLEEGKKVRVALVWDTNPAHTEYSSTSQPSSDLDLRVFKGSQRVAYSSSYDNTFEIVEFEAPSTGTYQIRIYRKAWREGGTSSEYRTYMGLAWWYE